MKKAVLSLLLVITVSILIMVGCAAPPAAPAPTPAAPTTPTASSIKPMELKFATTIPPVAPQYKLYEEWANKIKTASNGSVTITIYPTSTLLGEKDIKEGVMAGIADIGELILDDASAFPLNSLFTFPFLNLGDMPTNYKIWMAVNDQMPQVKAELKGFKVLFNKLMGGADLHTTKKQVRVPADIKGMKMLTFGILTPVLQDMGVAPMSLGLADMMTSLDRGLLEGMFLIWAPLQQMKIYPLLPYHTIFPSGTQLNPAKIVMSEDKWNKLPPDVQKAFNELTPWMDEAVRQQVAAEDQMAIDFIKAEAGQSFVTLTAAEEKMWFDAATPTREKYLADAEAKGIPVKAVYAEMVRLAKEYGK